MRTTLRPYPESKNSGLHWVGEVPIHWVIAPLRLRYSQCLDKMLDAKRNRGDYPIPYLRNIDVQWDRINTGNLPVIDIAPIEIDRFTVRTGDLLVCEGGQVGRSAIWNGPSGTVGFQKALHRLRSFSHSKDKPRFLYYAMLTAASSAAFEDGHESTIPHLTGDKLRAHRFPFPPVEEQLAIVRFLDHADQKVRRSIQSKKRLIELLNEQKQAIINHAVVRGIHSSTFEMSPSQGGRSRQNQRGIPWLTYVPDHWDISPSKRLFSVRKELARPDDIQLSATQAYGVIPQAEFEEKIGRKVVRIAMHLEKRRHVEKDDFVISMRSFQGGLERAWAMGCIRSSYVVLKPVSNVDVNFFTYLFKSHSYIQALRATANFIRDGQDLNFSNFCLVDLPLVPLDEQHAIAGYLDRATRNINVAMDRARNEVKLLHEYRTRLIADVVTGKLDAREAAEGLSLSVEQEIPGDDPIGLSDLDREEADDLDDSSELLPVAADED